MGVWCIKSHFSGSTPALHPIEPVGFSMSLQPTDPMFFSSFTAGPYTTGPSYSLFSSLPPQFPWALASPLAPPVVSRPAPQTSSPFFGSSFGGSPGVTRPQQDNPLFGSPMAALAQIVSHELQWESGC
ncbi:unnamed protein product [Cuscuta epithymum]|uniref:Uncharacterized protein n=1 Tax=Cuscuta epithymum TaxID=186058 RepID=A0AAV0DW20_9ASTE|nr:unnamed protein product [Cuscuta epithymum]